MHLIKKYANRKLYDTADKRYIKVNEITELIQAGEDVTIIDNSTGEDITADVVSQQLGENVSLHLRDIPLKVMIEVLGKGKNGLVDFTNSYVSFLQSTLSTLTGDRVSLFPAKDDRNSAKKTEPNKSDMAQHIEMINEIIDVRIEERLSKEMFATQKQMDSITKRLDDLSSKLESYEHIFSLLAEKVLPVNSDKKNDKKTNSRKKGK